MSYPAQILAWHGDPAIKADAVARMRAHLEADAFRQGLYGRFLNGRFRGCFHGCLTLEKLAEEMGWPMEEAVFGVSSSLLWEAGERLWGIPRNLADLLDYAFESFRSFGDAGRWAVKVTEAIPVGADLGALFRDSGQDDQDEHGGRPIEDWTPRELLDAIAACPVIATVSLGGGGNG